jgi:hypothetical protein
VNRRWDRLIDHLASGGVTQYQEAMELLMKFFEGNLEKSKLWMRTSNPNLGYTTPIHMIFVGRGPKLLKFMHQSLDENEREEKWTK